MTADARIPGSSLLSIAERFRRQAAATPGAIAVEADDAMFSYAALDAWVENLAQRLTGVGPEQVIGVCLRRSPALVAAVLAVLRARAVYLPLDAEAPPARIEFMLNDAAPTLLLYDETTKSRCAPSPAARLEVGSETECYAGSRSLADSLGCLPAPPAPDVEPGTPVYLLYTSGSTGKPKGVLMGAGALDNLIDWHLSELATEPGRRVAQFTAMGFDIWVQEVLTTLVSGATLVIPGADTRRDPARLARWLMARRITDLFCPNLMVEEVCESALAQGLILPDLAHIAQAGEQLTLGDAVRTFFRLYPGRRLHNHYGPTETHAATSVVLPLDPDHWPTLAPIGEPIPGTQVHLLDENLNVVTKGQEGEVYVSGAALARGYRRRPGLTAERFIPCPFAGPGERMYRTGDIARQLPGGDLLYLGRADQQLKIRGVRVELGEVAAAIRALPEVRDVAVVARGEGGTRLLDCYLVAAHGASDVVARVHAAVTETLLPEMVPATFTLLPALPTNSNGKIDRNALPLPPQNGIRGGSDGAQGIADPTPDLAQLVAECLDVDQVREDDDFFALGGHSLSAAHLAARIRTELGHEVRISEIFTNSTVAKLRKALQERERTFPPVRWVGRDRVLPASFAQERLWVLDQFAGPSDLYNVPIVVRLDGTLNAEALHHAMADLLERHEALRTRLISTGQELAQQVLPKADAAFLCREEVSAADLDQAVIDAARRPFNLGTEIPLRGTLFNVGDNQNTLLLLVHHHAVDGWSIKPLLKDLGFAYACRCAGFAPPWQPLPVQYADFALWQREQFEAARPATEHLRQETQWRAALRGTPALVTAHTDRPRPEVLGTAGGRVPVRLDRELHRAVRETARRTRTTVFMVVHAALALMLRLRGSEPDVVIGATVAGRLDGALDELVGLFVNTLALRVDLSGELTAADVLMRVRKADLSAFAAQELPFDLVVSAVNPPRTMSANPLFQVMLAFQTGLPEIPPLPGLHTSVEIPGLDTSKFDLTFELSEVIERAGTQASGIVGHLEYSSDLYSQGTARDFVRGLEHLLRVLTEEPNRSVDDLSLG